MYKQGAEIKVIECDAEVQRTYNYNGQLPTDVSGRGGTVFDPVFAFLRSNRLTHYDGCIYLTDGYADEPTIRPPCPLLWVITAGGNSGDHLRFGRIIKLPEI
jgi:predicted metal-dependent peptidase